MFKSVSYHLLLALCLVLSLGFSTAHAQNDFAAIPRIDAHAHVGNLKRMAEYMEVRNVLKEQYDVKLEIWIDLSSPMKPGGEGVDFLKSMEEKFSGRFLPCINDYMIADGLRFSPEELVEWKNRGVVGFKIWVGVSTAVNHPANDPVFTKMEQLGFVGASVHIAQPYPTSWCEDPVKFWAAQNAWQRVLDRHPNLVIVNAHMLDFFNSDEQLDYLMYMLETYSNLYVDLAARFQQFHRMDTDKLRKFVIKYSDRILFGTDISKQPEDGNYKQVAEQYNRCFQLLETDKIIKGGFFGETETKSLALPKDVLEKIYYKNAAKIYPRVAEVLKNLGYSAE